MALLFTCHDREIAYFFCPKGFFVIEFPKALHHQSLERASKGFIYLASCFCVKKCQSHTEFAQLTNFIATLNLFHIHRLTASQKKIRPLISGLVSGGSSGSQEPLNFSKSSKEPLNFSIASKNISSYNKFYEIWGPPIQEPLNLNSYRGH